VQNLSKMEKKLWEEVHVLIDNMGNIKMPEKWLTAVIFPVDKKGGKLQCSNYREDPPI
jgi:hypothetical protein